MSENENRNCGCNNMMKNTVAATQNNNPEPTTMGALNNNWVNDDTCPCKMESTQEEMLHQIKCLAFAIQELTLYLDTHPDDEKSLCLHNKYCREYRELTDKYQKAYGPLTSQFPCNKWRWIEEPWPWEGGMN